MAIRAGQLDFFVNATVRPHLVDFVSTRFQGSKNRLTEWIWASVHDLEFESVLDLFGGTGCVSHMFKGAGKRVVYNDVLRFNWHIARALLENSTVTLSDEEMDSVLARHPGHTYPTFIADTFSGIYFTDEENAWLDQTVHNIETILDDAYKQCIARFALYQSCIIKRPYNLFHRSNLYMRTADVKRSFGNATTWNRPFESFFRKFVREANGAIFDNGHANHALNVDALQVNEQCDLIYIDPPYVSDKRTATDYFGFYQFLEGLAAYEDWPERIDTATKHLAIPSPATPWIRPTEIAAAFDTVLRNYAHKILVISYRDDGIPSVDALSATLRHLGKSLAIHRVPQKYVLSTRATHEVLIVAS
ncbi:MAG: DNA adenine methylase [Vulcanimicrobiaceae bacterium]